MVINRSMHHLERDEATIRKPYLPMTLVEGSGLTQPIAP